MIEKRFHDALTPVQAEILAATFANMKTDFTTNVSGHFSPADLNQIYLIAKDKLFEEVKTGLILTEHDLTQAWNRVVADFHHHKHWGFETLPGPEPKPKKVKKETEASVGFLRTMVISQLFLKPGVYYFGLQYSKYPGEGYGWGLITVIAISLSGYVILIWKYRGMKD